MKKRKCYYLFLLISLLTVFSATHATAQDLSGQWRGEFMSGGGMFNEYVLELEVEGRTVAGYSYTYFIIMGKRCYVICKLKGTYDKESKYIVVTEFEKVKSNTPPELRDCFQTHMLTFFKQGDTELLKGNWKPATIGDNCGVGETQLERKSLVKVAPAKTDKKTPIAQNKTTPKTQSGTKKSSAPVTKSSTTRTPPKTTPKTTPGTAKSKPPVAKKTESTKTTKSTKKDVAKNNSKESKPETIEQDLPKIEKPKAPPTINGSVVKGVEHRSKQVIKTIWVDTASFRVDLYDNGQIDGDTVSLYFNGKLIVSRERLSAKPISLKIKINPEQVDNDLVMYAENLGSIPPNTSLMIVTVGDKRYEVNITSTDQTSGTVRFKLKD